MKVNWSPHTLVCESNGRHWASRGRATRLMEGISRHDGSSVSRIARRMPRTARQRRPQALRRRSRRLDLIRGQSGNAVADRCGHGSVQRSLPHTSGLDFEQLVCWPPATLRRTKRYEDNRGHGAWLQPTRGPTAPPATRMAALDRPATRHGSCVADVLLNRLRSLVRHDDLDLDLRPADLAVVCRVGEVEQQASDCVLGARVAHARHQTERDLALVHRCRALWDGGVVCGFACCRGARPILWVGWFGRVEAWWMLAVSVGMRQGEVLGLSWADVDLDEQLVTVRRALQFAAGEGLSLVPPKTVRSRRVIPISRVIADALKTRRKEQDRDRTSAGEFWEEWGLVFSTKFGTPIAPRNDYRDFRLIVERAGVRRSRLHDLRHTAASLMLTQGVNPRVVMEILGHSQISVTLNTYSHVSTTVSRDAVDGVSGLLWEPRFKAIRRALGCFVGCSPRSGSETHTSEQPMQGR